MINELIEEIIERRKKDLQSRIKLFPRERLIASDISDCDRYIVHSILDWGKRALYDEGLQAIFDRGKEEEKRVQKDLLSMDFKVVESETPFEIKNRKNEVICRGRIDGKIQYRDKLYPYELKTMNINIFNSIKSLDDFQKKPLFRKYLRQIQLYLFGHNAEEGLLILSNLQGHYKLLPVYLDLGECEFLLQRIEKIWEFIKKKEYPPQIQYNPALCDKCSFLHICLPEIKKEGVSLIDNEELEQKLNRREELKPLNEEYEIIDEEIKGAFREIPEAIIGTNWRIISQKREQIFVNTKAIPEEIRKKYEEKREVVTVRIIKL